MRKAGYEVAVLLGHSDVFGHEMPVDDIRSIASRLPRREALLSLAVFGHALARGAFSSPEIQVGLATTARGDGGGEVIASALREWRRLHGSHCLWFEPRTLLVALQLLAAPPGEPAVWTEEFRSVAGQDLFERWLLGINEWITSEYKLAAGEDGAPSDLEVASFQLPGTRAQLTEHPQHLLARAAVCLFDDPPPELRNRPDFLDLGQEVERVLGVPLRVLSAVLVAAWCYHYCHQDSVTDLGIPPNLCFRPFGYLRDSGLTRDEVRAAMACLGWSLEDLRSDLASKGWPERTGPLWVVSALKRPFIRLDDETWICVYPELIPDFAWSGVHHSLLADWLDRSGRADNDYTTYRGYAIEDYVVRLLGATVAGASGVVPRRAWFDRPGDYRHAGDHRPPDATIACFEGLAMVEVTTTNLRLDATMRGDPSAIDRGCRMLASKIDQLHARVGDYLRGDLAFTDHTPLVGDSVCPVLVVADPMPLSPWVGALIEDAADPTVLAGMSAVLPFQLLSLHDLEMLAVLATQGTDLWGELATRARDSDARWVPYSAWRTARGLGPPEGGHPFIDAARDRFLGAATEQLGLH